MRIGAVVLVSSLAFASLLPCCRGCSPAPQPSVSTTTHEPEPSSRDGESAEPVAQPTEAPPTPALAPTPAPAPAPTNGAQPTTNGANEVEVALTTTTRPVEEILAAASLSTEAAEAARAYVACRAVTDASACNRLAGDARSDCQVNAAQINARRGSATGWFANPELLAVCRAGGESDGPCRQYGLAIENHDPAMCPSALGENSDCPAVASGDMSRCRAGGERGCPERVRWYDALRQGVERAGLVSTGRFARFAAGIRNACGSLLAPLHTVPTPPAPPADQPPPAPAQQGAP